MKCGVNVNVSTRRAKIVARQTSEWTDKETATFLRLIHEAKTKPNYALTLSTL